VKLLTGCALVLLIIIMIPIAASCAGISILAIGGGAVVHDVLTLPTEAPAYHPATRQPAITSAPVPNEASKADAAYKVLAAFDSDASRLDDACQLAAGDDPSAQAACADAYSARIDARYRLSDCIDLAATVADVYRCGG